MNELYAEWAAEVRAYLNAIEDGWDVVVDWGEVRSAIEGGVGHG